MQGNKLGIVAVFGAMGGLIAMSYAQGSEAAAPTTLTSPSALELSRATPSAASVALPIAQVIANQAQLQLLRPLVYPLVLPATYPLQRPLILPAIYPLQIPADIPADFATGVGLEASAKDSAVVKAAVNTMFDRAATP
jgi:hypothetical protein